MARTRVAIDQQSLRRVFGNIQKARDLMLDKAEAFYAREAEAIMAAAERRVPVDEGDLKDSAFIEPVHRGRKGLSVAFGFGGPDVPYAIAIHEDVSAQFDDGEPKYLENPVREAFRGFGRRLANAVKL